MKMEYGYLNGWIKNWSHTQNISTKIVNPRDLVGNAEEEEECSGFPFRTDTTDVCSVLQCCQTEWFVFGFEKKDLNLFQTPVRTEKDVAAGLYLCALCLEVGATLYHRVMIMMIIVLIILVIMIMILMILLLLLLLLLL